MDGKEVTLLYATKFRTANGHNEQYKQLYIDGVLVLKSKTENVHQLIRDLSDLILSGEEMALIQRKPNSEEYEVIARMKF